MQQYYFCFFPRSNIDWSCGYKLIYGLINFFILVHAVVTITIKIHILLKHRAFIIASAMVTMCFHYRAIISISLYLVTENFKPVYILRE